MMLQIVTNTYKQIIELNLPLTKSTYTSTIIHQLTNHSMITDYKVQPLINLRQQVDMLQSRINTPNTAIEVTLNITPISLISVLVTVTRLLSKTIKHLPAVWYHTNINIQTSRTKFLGMRPRFEYSFTQLVLSTKEMVLVGMKQTLNNFWAWLRTHTIFVMRRGLRILQDPIASFKRRFFKYRKLGYVAPPEIKLKRRVKFKNKVKRKHKQNRAKKKVIINLKLEEKTDLKALRKLKHTMKIQMRQHLSAMKIQLKNPKLSSKKRKHKQKQFIAVHTRYLRYLDRLNKHKRFLLQTAKKRKFSLRKRLPKMRWLYRVLRFDFLKKLSAYFYLVRKSNTPPRLQYITPEFGARLKTYILQKPLYQKLKLNRALQGIINKATRVVKQNRIPPKSFQLLKKRYKRNRRALFQKLAQILKRFVAPLKYPLWYRKTFNLAFRTMQKKLRIAMLYLPDVTGALRPQMRQYLPTLEQRIGGRVPEVWFYLNIKTILQHLTAKFHLHKAHYFSKLSDVALLSRVNSIELKRIL